MNLQYTLREALKRNPFRPIILRLIQSQQYLLYVKQCFELMNALSKRILVTGFSPFDGREKNASLIAAAALKTKSVTQMTRSSINSNAVISNLEIPVEWGRPREVLLDAIKKHKPEIIISLGEGHVGEFNIETKARNVRQRRTDNLQNLPVGPNDPDGPDTITATIDAHALLRKINPNGDIPIKISSDAGGFICEETLYALERMKAASPLITGVVFVHLPPFGSTLVYQGKPTECDKNLLSDFTGRLIDGILSLSFSGAEKNKQK